MLMVNTDGFGRATLIMMSKIDPYEQKSSSKLLINTVIAPTTIALITASSIVLIAASRVL